MSRRTTRFPTAPWAPSEREADIIIVRHAPRLSRDLRLEVDQGAIELREHCERMCSVIASAGVTVEEAAWNIQRVFGPTPDREGG